MDHTRAHEELLQKALTAFQDETGLMAEFVSLGINYYGAEWDAEIRIRLPDGGDETSLFVLVKHVVSKDTLGPLKFQLDRANGNGILITEYANPKLMDELKENEIQCIDACGNAYIYHAPIYIFIKGNRHDRGKKYHAQTTPRAFQPTGLKLIFTLLCNPGLEDKPFRQIAERANVALGTVNIVLKNLEEGGYLIDRGRKGRKLIKKNDLLNKWVAIYPEVLRPKLMRGRFTALERNWWQNTRLPGHFYFGGEVAAARMTRYLKPEIITLYAPEIANDFLLKNKLRKDLKGEVEILEAFWINEDGKDGRNIDDVHMNYKNLVHPILVYADLVGIQDTRTNETAKMIYDNEIYRFIRDC